MYDSIDGQEEQLVTTILESMGRCRSWSQILAHGAALQRVRGLAAGERQRTATPPASSIGWGGLGSNEAMLEYQRQGIAAQLQGRHQHPHPKPAHTNWGAPGDYGQAPIPGETITNSPPTDFDESLPWEGGL